MVPRRSQDVFVVIFLPFLLSLGAKMPHHLVRTMCYIKTIAMTSPPPQEALYKQTATGFYSKNRYQQVHVEL